MNEDLRDVVLLIGSIVGGAALLLFAIASIGSRLTFPADVAEIESLRANAAYVDPQQSEDVVGQVVQVNRLIASNQAWNKVPVFQIAVPNGWDDIEPIAVPKMAP